MKIRSIPPIWRFGIMAIGAFAAGALIFNFGIMPFLVSHGEEVRVPDLTLCTVPQTERLLREQGLKLAETYMVFSPDVPKGCVVSQYPEPLAIVKRNRSVRIRVSSGEQAVSVPQLRGQSLRHAELVLGRAGLQLGRVAQVHSSEIEEDVIISTFPGPDALIEEGGSVDMLVSQGFPPVDYMMPQLVGMNVGAAQRLLENAGMVAIVDPLHPSARAKVTAQSPAFGTRIRRGTAVRLAAGRGE
ncbi:MAG: PASTA domain-containing protein [Candidatus Eisenbacteria bacterium]